MIATHTPKMFNARLRQAGVRARIIEAMPSFVICSQTVNMQNELWAAPTNAAHIGKYREEIESLPQDYEFLPDIPNITDTQTKQILLPTEQWTNGDYVSVTPLASMGVLHEVYHRLKIEKLPFHKWLIQSVPAAWANHGGALQKQRGYVRMLRRGVAKIEDSSPNEGWTGSFVQLKTRVEGMNISSGMVAIGWPALTAIGGLVHALERKTNCELEFALGMENSDWKLSVPKIAVVRGNSVSTAGGRLKPRTLSNGRMTSIGELVATPGVVTEEITANCNIVLLLRSKTQSMENIASELKKIYRIAGGSVFDSTVTIHFNEKPCPASYLLDASRDIEIMLKRGASDTLDAALKMYGDGGEWVNGWKWYQPRNGYTLNMSGYAYLESPVHRPGVRENYRHAWGESIFSLVTQGSMSDEAWWTRKNIPGGVIWKGGSN